MPARLQCDGYIGETTVLTKSNTLYHDVAHHIRKNGINVILGEEGVCVRDYKERTYIDALAGMWCVGRGHNDGGLIEVARAQSSTSSHCRIFSDRTNHSAVRPSIGLIELAPSSFAPAFFVNCGSEANDTALKLVWCINNARGKPAKKKVVTFDNAYYRSTVDAANLTALPHVHQAFGLPLFPVVRVPTPDARRLRRPGETDQQLIERLIVQIEETILAEDPETVGAFLAEPIAGAGSVVIPPDGFFRRLQTLLRRYDILLIADEITAGFDPSSQMSGSESVGIAPDMITVAKNLPSGYLPNGAVLMTPAIYETVALASGTIGIFACGMTYSGHPAHCAVALAYLDRYSVRGLRSRVRALGAYLRDRLQPFAEHASVADVRS